MDEIEAMKKAMEIQTLIMDANKKICEANSSLNSSWKQIMMQQAFEKMVKAQAIHKELCEQGVQQQDSSDDWWKSGKKPPELE